VALAGHELRTPLAALRGSLQLLQRLVGSADGVDRVPRYLGVALAQSTLLDDLIQDLTDVIRVQAGQLPISHEPVEFRQLVEEIVELARPLADGQDLRVEATDEDLTVSGDARRLGQVVMNLVSNALQHGASARGTDVRIHRENQFAVLEVADYGPGIPEAERELIFQRFYQAGSANERGLGVGLYLVHAIVVGHEGAIEVRASQPTGTTLVVRLPLLEASL
jgi:signal transduction histidine kinase